MNKFLQQKLKEFFDTHPGVDEVHEALGVLFLEKEKADKYCGGTGKKATTYTREMIEIALGDGGYKGPVVVEPDANGGQGADQKPPVVSGGNEAESGANAGEGTPSGDQQPAASNAASPEPGAPGASAAETPAPAVADKDTEKNTAKNAANKK